jgi:6,7-dimethyl-8-ribityllumazine synthase
LGAVIRGETVHFDLVANEAAKGVAEVARDTGIPVIFEVLAVENLAQAEDRAGGAHGNKGWEAADAVLSMVSLLEQLPDPRIGAGSEQAAAMGGTP